MHLDPILPSLAATALLLVAVGAVLRRYRQPSVIGYLIVGLLVGPHGLGLVEDIDVLDRLGHIGILFLLFFVGMETPIPKLVASWRILILGTAFQIAASVGAVFAVGMPLGWSVPRVVLLGFVISLSSTAVVLAVLRGLKEQDSRIGQLAAGVVIVQDVAVIPMLLTLGMLGGRKTDLTELALQVFGAILLVGIAWWSLQRAPMRMPLARFITGDRELELYMAFVLCFVLALVSGALGLSTALGAFIAGIVVSAVDEREWISRRLELFEVLLVGAFFVAVGAQIDLAFVSKHLATVVLLVAVAIGINTVINAAIFRASGATWREAAYGGALLSQIGEFSLVLAAVGLQSGIIEEFSYQMTIAIISLSLVVTPLYVKLWRRAHGAVEA